MTGEHQVLYRRHRPKKFSEVIGQEHVVGAIQNAIKMDRVAHAYLFSGPRGVGKTTIARLIAKALNCTDENTRPCNKCHSCSNFNGGKMLDVIEIDAASNRGIDEIRALREAVRYVPAEGTFKTYIIDETHMLTKEAFNALLKTLEEPPAHAVFVLATTEIDKVPATIISRTQHYTFRRPGLRAIGDRLISITKKENATLDTDAAHLIALAGEGSMRDAESILGQIMAVEDKHISQKEVEDILGLPKRGATKKMFELIINKEASAALTLIQEMNDSGQDLARFAVMLLNYFRHALFLKTDPALKKYVEDELLPDEIETIESHLPNLTPTILTASMNTISKNMQQFRRVPLPQLPLELTVLELIGEKTKED